MDHNFNVEKWAESQRYWFETNPEAHTKYATFGNIDFLVAMSYDQAREVFTEFGGENPNYYIQRR